MINEIELVKRLKLTADRLREFLAVSETKNYKKNSIVFEGNAVCDWLGISSAGTNTNLYQKLKSCVLQCHFSQ